MAAGIAAPFGGFHFEVMSEVLGKVAVGIFEEEMKYIATRNLMLSAKSPLSLRWGLRRTNVVSRMYRRYLAVPEAMSSLFAPVTKTPFSSEVWWERSGIAPWLSFESTSRFCTARRRTDAVSEDTVSKFSLDRGLKL